MGAGVDAGGVVLIHPSKALRQVVPRTVLVVTLQTPSAGSAVLML